VTSEVFISEITYRKLRKVFSTLPKLGWKPVEEERSKEEIIDRYSRVNRSYEHRFHNLDGRGLHPLMKKMDELREEWAAKGLDPADLEEEAYLADVRGED
jgi:hypothetical protein